MYFLLIQTIIQTTLRLFSEFFFSLAQQHNGNNRYPILLEFLETFKKLYFLDYFTHSGKANCINDLDLEILSKNPIDANKDINLMYHDNTPFQY